VCFTFDRTSIFCHSVNTMTRTTSTTSDASDVTLGEKEVEAGVAHVQAQGRRFAVSYKRGVELAVGLAGGANEKKVELPLPTHRDRVDRDRSPIREQ
jgi:hypothetical protein